MAVVIETGRDRGATPVPLGSPVPLGADRFAWPDFSLNSDLIKFMGTFCINDKGY
jgi:hypothetical protein